MKRLAPAPPVRTVLTNGGNSSGVDSNSSSSSDSASTDSLDGQIELDVELPSGKAIRMKVERRMAMMDLLVHVCTANKVNPGGHLIQLVNERGNGCIPYKPNTPIGSLNSNLIHVVAKPPAPNKKASSTQPFETTFRLQVHLPRNQLLVMRVSPRTPLADIFNKVCQEKNLDPGRYAIRHPDHLDESLNYMNTLNDYELTEVTIVCTVAAPLFRQAATDIISLQRDDDKRKKGFFGSLFKRTRSNASDSLAPDSRPNIRSGSVTSITSKSEEMEPPPAPSASSRISVVQSRSVKKRPAPQPPRVSRAQSQPVLSTLSTVSDAEAAKLPMGQPSTTSHSRHSSDSSGYHESECSSRTDSPATAGPSCSNNKSVSSECRAHVVPTSNLASTKSTSLISINSAYRKRRAPPPPRHTVSVGSECSSFGASLSSSSYSPPASSSPPPLLEYPGSQVTDEEEEMAAAAVVKPRPRPRTVLLTSKSSDSTEASLELTEENRITETDRSNSGSTVPIDLDPATVVSSPTSDHSPPDSDVRCTEPDEDQLRPGDALITEDSGIESDAARTSDESLNDSIPTIVINDSESIINEPEIIIESSEPDPISVVLDSKKPDSIEENVRDVNDNFEKTVIPEPEIIIKPVEEKEETKLITDENTDDWQSGEKIHDTWNSGKSSLSQWTKSCIPKSSSNDQLDEWLASDEEDINALENEIDDSTGKRDSILYSDFVPEEDEELDLEITLPAPSAFVVEEVEDEEAAITQQEIIDRIDAVFAPLEAEMSEDTSELGWDYSIPDPPSPFRSASPVEEAKIQQDCVVEEEGDDSILFDLRSAAMEARKQEERKEEPTNRRVVEELDEETIKLDANISVGTEAVIAAPYKRAVKKCDKGVGTNEGADIPGVSFRRLPVMNFSISTYKSQQISPTDLSRSDSVVSVRSVAETFKRASKEDPSPITTPPNTPSEKVKYFTDAYLKTRDQVDRPVSPQVDVAVREHFVRSVSEKIERSSKDESSFAPARKVEEPKSPIVVVENNKVEGSQAQIEDEYLKLHQQFLQWQKQLLNNQTVLDQQQQGKPASSVEELQVLHKRMSALMEALQEKKAEVEGTENKPSPSLQSSTLPRQKSKPNVVIQSYRNSSTSESSDQSSNVDRSEIKYKTLQNRWSVAGTAGHVNGIASSAPTTTTTTKETEKAATLSRLPPSSPSKVSESFEYSGTSTSSRRQRLPPSVLTEGELRNSSPDPPPPEKITVPKVLALWNGKHKSSVNITSSNKPAPVVHGFAKSPFAQPAQTTVKPSNDKPVATVARKPSTVAIKTSISTSDTSSSEGKGKFTTVLQLDSNTPPTTTPSPTSPGVRSSVQLAKVLRQPSTNWVSKTPNSPKQNTIPPSPPPPPVTTTAKSEVKASTNKTFQKSKSVDDVDTRDQLMQQIRQFTGRNQLKEVPDGDRRWQSFHGTLS